MSRVPTSALTDLIELAQEPSSTKRRELLRQVTGIFMTNPEEISGPEMELYDSVMSQLTADMETLVRAEISTTISQTRNAPLGLLRRLASDDIAVAEPILTRSQALSETDLMHIVSTQGQDHLRAVSRRDSVPESVSGVIVNRGDDTTLHTLLSNDGARLSRATNEQVIQRAQANPALHEVVVNRADMPVDLMNDMYFVVEARLREVRPHGPEHPAGDDDHVRPRLPHPVDRLAGARAQHGVGRDQRPVEVGRERAHDRRKACGEDYGPVSPGGELPPVALTTNEATFAISWSESWPLNEGMTPLPFVTRAVASR